MKNVVKCTRLTKMVLMLCNINEHVIDFLNQSELDTLIGL